MTTSLNTAEPQPAGLPDVAALASLANQFFRALPNQGAPDSPGGLSPSASAPMSVPAGFSQPVGAPVDTSLFGGGLPLSAPSPSLPGALEATRGVPSIATAASPSLGLNAQQREPESFHALPGFPNVAAPFVPLAPDDAALRALLPAAGGPHVGGQLPAQSSSFYFLEHARPQTSGISVPGLQAESPRLTGLSPAGLNVGGVAPLDAHLIRRDFPILSERVNGKQLVWLDNAATTQKPRQVIERISYFYQHENSNIHRAAHELAARSTDAYEAAREKVRGFLHARSASEIVFVRGATEAINLVAKSWGRQHIGKDDEIIISTLEHHANIVPWQQLIAETGAKLRVIPVDDDGQLRMDEYAKLLGPKTKLVSVTQVSNALGTVTPVQQVVGLAHAVGARVLIDGAQAVSHMPIDVTALDADWYVFSGHKVFGPTGIGVLYGKEDLLNETLPWQGGGNMIEDVTFEQTRYQKAPARFEAGTGNIADAVGLGAAIDYVTALGMEKIAAYEHGLLEYGTWLLKGIAGLRLVGTAPEKASVLSFVLEGFKTEQIGAALNEEGIAVRSGHHCAQPILRRFGLEATVRPSLAFYNTCAELDHLASAIHRIRGRKSSVAVPGSHGVTG